MYIYVHTYLCVGDVLGVAVHAAELLLLLILVVAVADGDPGGSCGTYGQSHGPNTNYTGNWLRQ